MPSTKIVDFSNTATAFAGKTDEELKKTARLFGMMHKPWLVGMGAKMGLAAIKMRLPFVKSLIKATIFEQFCGGATLQETQKTIHKLYQNHGTQVILDYGAEAKDSEQDFEATVQNTLEAIEFAAINTSVPVVSLKMTGIGRFALYEKKQSGDKLSLKEKHELNTVKDRLHKICQTAEAKKVGIFIDAEESWIQDVIDDTVDEMMEKYNQQRCTVYNTFQLYRHDTVEFLERSYQMAIDKGFILGAKLVRGAYLEKEKIRSDRHGYPSLIQPNKTATNRDFNIAVRYCIDRYEKIAICNASHNLESCLLQAQLISEKGIPKDHPHLNFCQLYGMGDHITFNLAKAGYNTAKYVPYGPVSDVIPYLIRRAQENTAVTGDMSRELSLVTQEMKRRKLC